jgi:hypothetical protein
MLCTGKPVPTPKSSLIGGYCQTQSGLLSLYYTFIKFSLSISSDKILATCQVNDSYATAYIKPWVEYSIVLEQRKEKEK